MDLQDYLDTTAEDIDKSLFRTYGTVTGELDRASAHLLLAGGKRLRPAVVMLAADAIRKGLSRNVMPAALALEVTHTFTLIHDDIMDGDEVRRGVATVHAQWDQATAILAGDVLYAQAFELLCKSDAEELEKVRAVMMLARTCAEICKGQHMDIAFASRQDVTEIEYLDMVSKKTGALYAAAASIGGSLAGGNAVQTKALFDWGLNSGIAFQIQDDLIDLVASAETSGKDRASDLREGKQTLIAIKAREHGVDLAGYRKETLSDAEIDSAIAELEGAGVLDEVREAAARRVDVAKKSLANLPESEARQHLSEITDYFVTRGF
ncbi:MAG: polyprenyl synthetase family protein [Methanomicrobiaceae archaeon]|nr:polyprenyl synthetase family protein [Methanomicrobiaceae archaeon]